MAKARVVNGIVQDVAPGDPDSLYTAEIAALYTTTVPDGTAAGATKVGNKWTNPAPSEPPAPTLESVKARLHDQIVQIHARVASSGVRYEFPDGETDVIQTRSVVDTMNVTGMVVAAQELKSQGEERAVLGFRGESNVTHQLTPQQMIDMGMAVQGATLAVYLAKWEHDAAIDALETIESANAYDVTAGWPT